MSYMYGLSEKDDTWPRLEEHLKKHGLLVNADDVLV